MPARAQTTTSADNILIGPAAGIGGAFTATADDPTALLFNPAGLVAIKPNKRSLSYNAFMTTTYEIDNVLFNSAWKGSSTFSPVFVGTSYRNDAFASDWTFAGGVYDRGIYAARIRWKAEGTADESMAEEPQSGTLESASRETGSAMTVAGGAARRTSFGAVGFQIGLRQERRSYQEYMQAFIGPIDIGTGPAYSQSITNTDTQDEAYGVDTGLGMLWMHGAWAFGASASQLHYVSQKSSVVIDQYYATVDASGAPITVRIGDRDIPTTPHKEQERVSPNRPFGRAPARYRIGIAHKITSDTRWSADIVGRGEGYRPSYRVKPGIDAAVGMETTLSRPFALQMGAFTMWDPGNTISSRSYKRADSYVDSFGITSAIKYRSDTWSASLGAMHQRGQGKTLLASDSSKSRLRNSMAMLALESDQ